MASFKSVSRKRHGNTLTMLYIGAVIGGLGGGAVHATCVGLVVKWFPDRRGLAGGLTAAGYGAALASGLLLAI